MSEQKQTKKDDEAQRCNLRFFLFPLKFQYSVKFFDTEFSPVLYVLRSHESKKLFFHNWLVRMCVTVWKRLRDLYL